MNHDAFFVYGLLLKYFKGTKIVIHMRTMLPFNYFASFQAKCIANIADHLIFISNNELYRFMGLSGKPLGEYSVIYNAVETEPDQSLLFKGLKYLNKKFKVLYLGNLTYNKGADRLPDIAMELNSNGVNNVIFIVCGEDRQAKGKKTELEILKQADLMGVSEYLCFMGHQTPPDPFLQQADILIRLSRWNDPWGRDIIEAMAYGKPVLATGSYDKFVEDGVNGYLFPEFDPERIAKKIIYLSEHPEVVVRMRDNNINKAKRLFDGPTNSAKVAAIYDSLIKS